MAKQGLKAARQLSERKLQELRELASICDAADGIELKMNWSMLEKRGDHAPRDFMWYENGRLVGFLAIYQFNPNEAEIGGMVHPEFRRRRIFTALAKQAEEAARQQGIPKLLYVCPNASEAGRAFLEGIHSEYSFSEYGMKLVAPSTAVREDLPEVRLVRAGPEDRDLLIRLDSQGFEMSEEDGVALVDMTLASPASEWPYIVYNPMGTPLGRFNVHVRDGNAHIFCFSVLPSFRGQGYGRRILTEAVKLCLSSGQHSVTLEVECKNRKALELYQSCGFRETYINDYYSRLVIPAEVTC